MSDTETVGVSLDDTIKIIVEQLRNQYNHPNATEEQRARYKAQERALIQQTELLKASNEAFKEVLKANPELAKKMADTLQGTSKQAAAYMQELNKALREHQQKLASGEVEDRFKAAMGVAEGSTAFLRMGLNIALALKSIGFDTSEYIENTRKDIADAYARVPPKDVASLATLDMSVAHDFNQLLRAQYSEAQRVLTQATGTVAREARAAGSATRGLAGASDAVPPLPATPPAGAASGAAAGPTVKVTYVAKAVEELIAEGRKLTGVTQKDIHTGVAAAAKADGTAATVSGQDTAALESQVTKLLTQGGSDPKAAADIARRAIDRANIRQVAGHPEPALVLQ